MPTPPALEALATFTIELGESIEVGTTTAGERRIIPITGGTVDGPALRGRILPGGADFQLLRSETLTELDARYAIETDDGETVYVENRGLRSGSAADLERLRRGEPVDPSNIYFRTAPRLEATGPRWAWLTAQLFVATGRRKPFAVVLDVFAVR